MFVHQGCVWPSHHQECWPPYSGQVCKGKMHVLIVSAYLCIPRLFFQVLSALLKKKYLVPRSELQLDWKPLFELFQVFFFPSINPTLQCVVCFSIGKTRVQQLEGCWRRLKASRPRSSPLSRWGGNGRRMYTVHCKGCFWNWHPPKSFKCQIT